jgi:hypothetical protein
MARRRVLASIAVGMIAAGLLVGCGSGSGKGRAAGAAGSAGSGSGGAAAGSTSGGSGSQTTTTGTRRYATAKPNGLARRSADQIVAAATQAMRAVTFVHVSGSVVDNGIPVRLDLSLVRGQGGQGQISENGLAFRLISDHQMLYILGSDAFWTHFGGATAARVFHGKWLKTRDAGEFASIGDLASISRLFGQLLAVHGKLARAGRAVVSGQPAIGVTDRTQGGTLFVATTGKPYPLEIVKRGTNGGRVTFDRFDVPVKLTPPARAIRLPSLG